MKHPRMWWQSWSVLVIGLAVLIGGVVPFLMPEKKPVIIEPEAEIYLQQQDGHGITRDEGPMIVNAPSPPPPARTTSGRPPTAPTPRAEGTPKAR